MSGHISVTSEKNTGSIFIVDISICGGSALENVPQFTTIHISADLSGAQVFIDEDNDFNAEIAAAWIERIWRDRHSRYGWSLGRPYYPNHLTVNAFAGDITLSLEAGICSSASRQTRSFRLSHVICIDKQKARLVCLLFAYFPAAFVAETERWNSFLKNNIEYKIWKR